MNKWSLIAAAVLGVAIGVLATLVYQSGTSAVRPAGKTSPDDWSKLNLVLQGISENYVDTVDHGKLSEAAIEAVLSELDPHSVYMPPVELERSNEELAAGFDGIGIQFNVPNDTAVVIEVIAGGPSEKIGLLAGDRIMKVDETVIAGVNFPQDSMVRRMKGPAGTKVLITVKRGEETIPFEITRGKIPTHSVDAYFMVNDTTGYLRLSKFSRSTTQEVTVAGAELLLKGMKKLIFDIRGNTGGYFDQALTLSDMFLERKSTIVIMRGAHRKTQIYQATGKGILRGVSLAVLIDDSSASSSEIFAGAMQDNRRATIIGRRSFGKGLVQEPIAFDDGSGVRLTVARFYTPGGRCLQKPYSDDYAYEVYRRYDEGEMVEADSMKVESGGIIPDIFVPMDTTRATRFYMDCYRKATGMRFASAYFDTHRDELSPIDNFDSLVAYLDGAGLERQFLAFARERDGLVPGPGEWENSRSYLMTQVRALVGRYSKLNENAYYHLFLPTDAMMQKAIGL